MPSSSKSGIHSSLISLSLLHFDGLSNIYIVPLIVPFDNKLHRTEQSTNEKFPLIFIAVPPGGSTINTFSRPDKFSKEIFPKISNRLNSTRFLNPCILCRLLF